MRHVKCCGNEEIWQRSVFYTAPNIYVALSLLCYIVVCSFARSLHSNQNVSCLGIYVLMNEPKTLFPSRLRIEIHLRGVCSMLCRLTTRNDSLNFVLSLLWDFRKEHLPRKTLRRHRRCDIEWVNDIEIYWTGNVPESSPRNESFNRTAKNLLKINR